MNKNSKTWISAPSLFQQPIRETRLPSFFRHPLARIILAILFLMPIIQLHNAFSFLVLDKLDGPALYAVQFPKAVLLIWLMMVSYHAYCRRIEGREALELGSNKWLPDFARGAAMGGGMIAVIVGMLAMLGYYSIGSTNEPFILVARIFRYGQGSFLEDLLFTVVLFRLLEEFAGTIAAYILVSALFGSLHLLNDNSSLMTSAFISIQQVTFLAPFILTRRLWMTWAVHFAWNYSQTGVFGMNNSGMAHHGFITPIINGPVAMTGGDFGPEGSYLSLAVNLAVGVPLLVLAWRRNQFVAPLWRRNKEVIS